MASVCRNQIYTKLKKTLWNPLGARLDVLKCLPPHCLTEGRHFSAPAKTPAASPSTNFGYKEVPEGQKSQLVGEVFKSVAAKYDRMNDLMSVGLHRLWKDRLVSKLRPFVGMQHLDMAGGTGDVAFRVLEAVREAKERTRSPGQGAAEDEEDHTRIIVCDINPSMLEVGRQRARSRGYGDLDTLVWMEGDAERLPLESSSIDSYTVAFGLRNVTHLDEALREAHRLLRPGGQFLCLEFAPVQEPALLKHMYDAYSFAVIPALGEAVAGDRQAYQYLVESIRKFPSQERFRTMIQEAGFKLVGVENILGGIVAIHSGFKL